MRNICSHKTVLALSLPTLFFVYHIPYSIRFLEGLIPMGKCELYHADMKLDNAGDKGLNFGSRTDVQTCTYWGAPIIWDGMFNPEVYDRTHTKDHTSVALTVFAVGRYLDVYLKDFLISAELHFMVGFPVTYYVFTDVPEKIPALKLASGRKLKLMPVKRHSRWQDVSMMRMKSIRDAIDSYIQHNHQYVFCMDVDQVFRGRFGTEALGDSVALLHAHYYHRFRRMWTYDRNPKSQAYMADSQGDFYYHAAVFGGSWQSVKQITDTCYRTIMEDKKNRVEALWHDESHLNKYFWKHKPSKVLSPEYCWDTSIGYRSDIHIARLLWQEKQYDRLRGTGS
ncbi:alpha-1,3-galactosyltransferase 2-like [Alosa sapidissima]|uniref:alpha-1,3-galactosyltransferase 2-like n=1 Tax=Alosa sapidissima TaxID=34773 RepID=UPI001C08880E|nr:alpha-1,3-galactosyltransferase 2-like [Alosa sapidissima]